MLYISFDGFDINLLTLKGDLILILQWTFILIGSSSVAFFSHIFCDWWNAEDKKMGIIEGFPRKTKINENFILLTEVKEEVKEEVKKEVEEGKEVETAVLGEIEGVLNWSDYIKWYLKMVMLSIIFDIIFIGLFLLWRSFIKEKEVEVKRVPWRLSHLQGFPDDIYDELADEIDWTDLDHFLDELSEEDEDNFMLSGRNNERIKPKTPK